MERRKGEVTTMGTVLVCARSLFLVFVHSGIFVLLLVNLFALIGVGWSAGYPEDSGVLLLGLRI